MNTYEGVLMMTEETDIFSKERNEQIIKTKCLKIRIF